MATDDSEHSSSFAESALRLSGKDGEEIQRSGQLDRADDQAETLFQSRYQTSASPIHRIVWDGKTPIELFHAAPDETDADVQRVMERSLAVVMRHRDAGTLYDTDGKLAPSLLQALGKTGYWGLRVERKFGGAGATFRCFARFLTRMATVCPAVAGLASVHGCIGAIDPLQTFGTPDQQRKFLPQLASGERLSAFALTEPAAGSDLTAIHTTAVRDGGEWVINGEKLFITNAIPGRTIGLVCQVENQPAVVIAQLPDGDDPHVEYDTYGQYALQHTHNRGIRFRDFRVPADHMLQPSRGDGLSIAYHGLNLGRVAVCAHASGNMRTMLASLLPWVQRRVTFGQPIARRELVQRRIGRLAGLIVACDALVDWCASLLDQGFRGELECIVAKVFGSESQKEAAVELMMKTHGGRSFLHGHPFGDRVYEFLAPCIYEGEGELLNLAFFKTLVKQHGVRFFEPLGKASAAAGIKQPNPWNPRHWIAVRRAAKPYVTWWLNQHLVPAAKLALPQLPDLMQAHARFAAAQLQRSRFFISRLLRRHGLRLADRQCVMSDMATRIQSLVVILCTSLYASRRDADTQQAADVICRELTRKYLGLQPTEDEFHAATCLGARITDGGFQEIGDVAAPDLPMI